MQVHPGWAMTVAAGSLAELETLIKEQQERDQAPVPFPGDSGDLAQDSGCR